MQIDADHSQSLHKQAPSLSHQQFVEHIAEYTSEIQQLRNTVELQAMQLQTAQSSLVDINSQCSSLQIKVSSQELQLRTVMSQAAAEKSSFVQEKEHLHALFDKQQALCVSLTSQVVELTANCERLQHQITGLIISRQLEKDQLTKDVEETGAALTLEKDRHLAAATRLKDLETVCSDLQLKLESEKLLSVQLAQKLEAMTGQLLSDSLIIAQHERFALANEVFTPTAHSLCILVRCLTLSQSRFILRRSRGCQTDSRDDMSRSNHYTSMVAAVDALQQLKADCNQALFRWAQEAESDRDEASV
jgi:chromosome segregation ATPase